MSRNVERASTFGSGEVLRVGRCLSVPLVWWGVWGVAGVVYSCSGLGVVGLSGVVSGLV
ncbi:hypothetical protein JCM4814A_51740 [Streptomyces phaeofaciens JCM 4814]